MKTHITLLTLALLTLSGCATGRPLSASEQDLVHVRTIIESHRDAINLLIHPYRIHCKLREWQTPDGAASFISISGKLPSGAVTHRTHYLLEQNRTADTTTYAGLIRALPHDTLKKLSVHFDDFESELVMRHYTLTESPNRFSTGVWLTHPQLESQQTGAECLHLVNNKSKIR
jgi:hypothetical protein